MVVRRGVHRTLVSGARNVAGMFAICVPSVARTQALVSNGVITTVDHGARNARIRKHAVSVSRASNFAVPVAAYKRPACRREPQTSKYILPTTCHV